MSERLTTYLEAIKTSLDESKLFKDVRIQLDPYDLEDVTQESFQAPAARILFTTGKLAKKARGAFDMECVISLAIIAKRIGRNNPAFASADIAALNLTNQTCQVILDEPYFKLTKLSAADLEGFKVAVSEKANEQGLAITVILLRQTLFDVAIERAAIGQVIGTQEDNTPLEFDGGDDDF